MSVHDNPPTSEQLERFNELLRSLETSNNQAVLGEVIEGEVPTQDGFLTVRVDRTQSRVGPLASITVGAFENGSVSSKNWAVVTNVEGPENNERALAGLDERIEAIGEELPAEGRWLEQVAAAMRATTDRVWMPQEASLREIFRTSPFPSRTTTGFLIRHSLKGDAALAAHWRRNQDADPATAESLLDVEAYVSDKFGTEFEIRQAVPGKYFLTTRMEGLSRASTRTEDGGNDLAARQRVFALWRQEIQDDLGIQPMSNETTMGYFLDALHTVASRIRSRET